MIKSKSKRKSRKLEIKFVKSGVSQERILLFIGLVVLATFYLAVISPKAKINAGNVSGRSNSSGSNSDLSIVKARLTGHGEVDELNMKMTIAAVLNGKKDAVGGVSGQTITWKNFKADVTEVVPPSGDINYWCVGASVRSPEDASGFKWLWFIKDLPEGDRVGFMADEGLTCENVGLQSDDAFLNLSKGDFKGELN